MITINLPKRNRLINKIFNTIRVHESNNDQSLLTHRDDVLLYILKQLQLECNIDEIHIDIQPEYCINGYKEKEQNGQFITILDSRNGQEAIHYVFFSYEFPNGTRNGYIVSKTPISYRAYINDPHANKSYNVFLLSVKNHDGITTIDDNVYRGSVTDFSGNSYATNDYQTFAYKLCRTLNINILNYEQLDWSQNRGNQAKAQTPFRSIREMKNMRNGMVRANNKSSYIIENANDTILYGKTFGNNGFEIILMAAAAKAITNGTVYLWQIKDTNTLEGADRNATPITQENLSLLEHLGIECFDELQDYTPNEEALMDGDARNQAEFMRNLIRKFGSDEKKCYLCNCNIQKLIIASHIHRVCDINKENIPFEQKRAKAVSPDNGFWLCANHDKLFEHGLIYFDENGVMQKSGESDLTEEQVNFVNNITESNTENPNEVVISPNDFNDDMQTFIALHRKRTHPELV